MAPAGLRAVIEQQAAHHGGRRFLTLPDAAFSFADVDDLADRMGAVLLQRGVGPGEVVAGLAGNGWTAIATWFGCAKVGAVYLPVNPLLTGRPLTTVLTHARARLLVAEADRVDAVLPLLGALPALRQVLVSRWTDGAGAPPAGLERLEPLLDAAGGRPELLATTPPPPPSSCTPRAPPACPRAWCGAGPARARGPGPTARRWSTSPSTSRPTAACRSRT